MTRVFGIVDAIIFAAIICGAFFAFGAVYNYDDDGDGRVVVYHRNAVVAEYPLSANLSASALGNIGEIIFMIDDGALSVTHANCPRQICMRGGAARPPHGQIICAPNNILIQIRASRNGKDHEHVDAVTY